MAKCNQLTSLPFKGLINTCRETLRPAAIRSDTIRQCSLFAVTIMLTDQWIRSECMHSRSPNLKRVYRVYTYARICVVDIIWRHSSWFPVEMQINTTYIHKASRPVSFLNNLNVRCLWRISSLHVVSRQYFKSIISRVSLLLQQRHVQTNDCFNVLGL